MTPLRSPLRGVYRYMPRWLVTLALTTAWYTVLLMAHGYARDHYDIFDPAEGTHMGDDAVEFRYGLAFALASLVPPVLGGLRRAKEERALAPSLWCMAWIAAVSTAAFYMTGAAGCDRIGVGPGQEAHGFTLLGAGLVIPALVTALTRSRGGRIKLSTLALLAGATAAFFYFLQAGHCASFSKKVGRHVFPLLWFPMTFALGLAGAWAGRIFARRVRLGSADRFEDTKGPSD